MGAPVDAVIRSVRLGPGELPAPGEAADAARSRAEEILARPELRPPARTLLQRLFDFLGDVLRRLVEGVGGDRPWVGWVVVAATGILLAAVVVLLTRSLQRSPGSRHGVEVDGVGRPPADWRADAARHEAAGAWRDALRCHWRALVADLAARGLVEEVPGRTTGEYRSHVGRAVPGAARSFAGATVLFEVAWYAADEIGPDDVAEERRLGAEVLVEAAR